MIRRIRSLSNDKQGTGYDDVDILAAINDAVAFVGRMIKSIRPNLLQQEKMGVLDFHNPNICLTEKVAGIQDVRVNGRKLKPTQPRCIKDLEATSAQPECYYMRGFNNIRVHPVPCRPLSYTVIYTPQIPYLCIHDRTPFPNDFDSLIAEYANARLNMTNEFDMSQEMSIVQAITSQIEDLLYAYPDDDHQIAGYWDWDWVKDYDGDNYLHSALHDRRCGRMPHHPPRFIYRHHDDNFDCAEDHGDDDCHCYYRTDYGNDTNGW